jgi:nucleotide-binding universal stress UspA family protein
MKAGRKQILVPYDFSGESEMALSNTISIARFLKGNIILLYVIEKGDFISQLFQSDTRLNEIENEARKKLDKIALDTTNSTGVHVSGVIKFGKVYEKILEAAKEHNARFIILGKRANRENEKRLLGSKITRVVREADTPVITMKGTDKNPIKYKKILVPIDLTKRTREKLFNAIAFGTHYDATIQLVSVLMGGIKARESRIYKKLQKIEQIIKENGVKCTVEILERSGKPIHKAVLDYSKEVNSDMIMVMTHKESVINDSYIGAVAYEIINESDIPVISFNALAARADEDTIFRPMVDPLGIWK